MLIVIYVVCFVLVTGGIMFLNTKYKNIFEFDFSPVGEVTAVSDSLGTHSVTEIPQEEEVKDSTDLYYEKMMEKRFSLRRFKEYITKKIKKEMVDSLNRIKIAKNKEINEIKEDFIPIDTTKFVKRIKDLNSQLSALKTENGVLKQENENFKKRIDTKVDYDKWKKQTAKLYESMDAKSASKIIQKYSDNVARDILYSMKRKQAAEILAQLTPEIANRITRAK